MKSLFGGLDEFGMDDIEGLDLFEEKEAKKKEVKKKLVRQEDMLYDRSIRCPVCNIKFMARTIKSGSAKLEETSINLRPIYSGIDPMIYDVVSCETCGYSALNRNFNKISDRQAQLVKEKISYKFVGKKTPMVYDYALALTRYKMALYNDVVIGRNDINKAYLCLKTSWVIEGLIEETSNESEKAKLKEERLVFINNAFKGFTKAYDGLIFPVFGMNEATYHYLLGALAYELEDMKMTSFWLGKVLLSPNGHKRLKDKARELKAVIDKDKKDRDEIEKDKQSGSDE